jgi:hypothetical protein
VRLDLRHHGLNRLALIADGNELLRQTGRSERQIEAERSQRERDHRQDDDRKTPTRDNGCGHGRRDGLRVSRGKKPSGHLDLGGRGLAFADPAGGAKYNVDLSKRRADAVKTYLASNLGGDIRTIGYGKTRLVVPNASGDQPGADQNRRVVFVIESAQAQASGVAMTAQQ